MRGAVVAIVAAGLALAGALVASSHAETVRYARANAAVAIVGDKSFGAITVSREGDDVAETSVDKGNVVIAAGSSAVNVVDPDHARTATAAATARQIVILGGRIRVHSVLRAAAGPKRSGEIDGLRVDGQAYGPIRQQRTLALEGGGELTLNDGDTGLHLVTDELDVRIAVVATSTFTREVKPTPTPKPAKTAKPTPTPSPSPTPAGPPKRLTAGGYAFPVYGDVNYDSTFGAPRAPPIGFHEGNDIFAEFGSPVVAVTDGHITKVGTLEISGNRLWVIADNGDGFFYAHLSSFSDRARNGARVKAGEVLGFVGNTGDAEETPPHVHFEVHPGGIAKEAVDPYPILRSWQADEDVPPGAWLQRLGADATERPGALVAIRDFIAE